MSAGDQISMHGSDELSSSMLLGQDRIVELLALGVPADEIFDEICAVAARRFGGVRCAVLVPDETRAHLALRAGAGLSEGMAEALGALDLTAADTVFPALAGAGTQVVESIAREERCAPLVAAAREAGLEALWSAGIRTPGRGKEEPADGLLLFLLPGERRPSPRGIRVLEMLARLAGLALERDRLTRERERESSLDPLTRLPNRQLFDRLLADLVELASPVHTRFAVILVDIDGFAEVNQQLGANAGDLFLRSFGRRLANSLRQGDIAARLGGDEFALLVRLEGVPDEDARLAERLLGVVRRGFEFGGESVRVTASFGLALYPWDGVEPGTLLAHAELALRAAQARGGDRSSHYSPAIAAPSKVAKPAPAPKAAGSENAEWFRVSDLELLWEPALVLSTRRLAALAATATLPRGSGERVLGPDLWRLAARGNALASANRWWIRHALERAAGWISEAPEGLVVTLPLALPQLADGSLVIALLDELAAQRRLAPRVEVVLPELVSPRDFDWVRELAAGIGRTGARLALGEVGAAPLPLDLLRERPAWRWRFAPALVRAATRARDSGDLLDGLIAFAHRLGATVEAAGLESHLDLSWLVAHRCDWASGRAVRAPLDDVALRVALAESTSV